MERIAQDGTSVVPALPLRKSPLPVLFVCASDTLVRLLIPVADALLPSGAQVLFAKLQFTDEAAEFELARHRPRSDYLGSVRHTADWLSKFGCVVMGNDWGREARALILLARRIGIPTVCVQESVINLTDSMRRMRYAEHVLVQGEISASMLADRERIRITGNPRYERLHIEPRPPVAHALLNCNFTYGVEEDHRHAWLGAAVQSCVDSKLAVTILQHPRDAADLSSYGCPVIRTSAATIHDRLKEGSVVVTRFSSLIHEAIALGRPAVYFNPHNESQGYDFGPACSVLRRASSTAELKESLTTLRESPPSSTEFETYLRSHIRPTDTLPSVACAREIGDISAGGAAVAGHPARYDRVRRARLLAYCIAEKFYLLARDRL